MSDINHCVIGIRELTTDEVSFSYEFLEEEESYENHFCSDEPELDRELERKIGQRLANGDILAWCTIKVIASFKEHSYSDYLGCCSYDSIRDFEEICYDNMKSEALHGLNEQLKKAFLSLKSILTI